jgi:hypothetical protein
MIKPRTDIPLAFVAFALFALTGAAQAAQQSCTFSSSDAKITYLFEVHSDGLEEIGSMTNNSVKISPPADRPRWKIVDHPGVSIGFISPDGDGFSIDDHSALAIAMIKGVPYAGGCRLVTGAAHVDDADLEIAFVMNAFIAHGSLACGHGEWTDRAKSVEVSLAQMDKFSSAQLADMTGIGFRNFDDNVAKVGKDKACHDLDVMLDALNMDPAKLVKH